jgi:hypothetical protein
MSEAINKILKAAKKQQTSPAESDIYGVLNNCLNALTKAITVEQLKQINEMIVKIKKLLVLREVGKIDQKAFGDQKPVQIKAVDQPDETRKAMMLGLEKIAVNKLCQKTKKNVFLLHRATTDFEYDKSVQPSDLGEQNHTNTELPNSESTAIADNVNNLCFESKTDTEWVVDFSIAEKLRIGENPIVSAWIPEDEIKDVSGSQKNKSTWGEMAVNPQIQTVTVTVKPCKVKIYSELKT